MPHARRALLLVAALLLPAQAFAAGFFLTPRGVRPLARGGAFVAGADDPGALGYNPAGLAYSSSSALLDLSYPWFETTYTRTVRVPGTSERVTLSLVTGQDQQAPIPTLAVAHRVPWVRGLTVGAGILADIPALQNWPSELADGSPAPQRYAIIDYRGTAMVKGSFGAAYRVGQWLSIGATFQLLFGTFSSRLTLSNCDGVVCTSPENPDFDAVTEIAAENIVVPGASVGVIATPLPWLRLGLAWETGYDVEQTARLRIRFPRSPLFDGAELDPPAPTATVFMSLPMQLRAGVEARFEELVRGEVSFVWEPWSVHREIRADPGALRIRNVQAIGDYSLETLSIPRGFRDTFSVRGGVEVAPRITEGRPLVLRAGLMVEPSAIPDAMLTAMVVDFDKLLVTLGAGYRLGALTLEFTYAYVHLFPRTITNSAVKQINAIRPPFEGTTTVGDGTYEAFAHVFGVGARVALGSD